jgi:hypothetical protein
VGFFAVPFAGGAAGVFFPAGAEPEPDFAPGFLVSAGFDSAAGVFPAGFFADGVAVAFVFARVFGASTVCAGGFLAAPFAGSAAAGVVLVTAAAAGLERVFLDSSGSASAILGACAVSFTRLAGFSGCAETG